MPTIEFAYLLLIASLLVSLGCVLWLLRIRRELKDLRTRVAAMVPTRELPSELVELVQSTSVMLSVHVLNPMELAAQRHWLAGAAGRLTPGVVRPIVAREVVRMVRSEMERFGVKADVRVIRHA